MREKLNYFLSSIVKKLMRVVMRKLALPLVLIVPVIALSGCYNFTLNVLYDPVDYPPQIFSSKDKRPVLYIDPIVDNREIISKSTRFGVRSGRFEEDPKIIIHYYMFNGSRHWRTSKTHTEIIREALETEIRRFGIKTTEDLSLAGGVLKASIERFDTSMGGSSSDNSFVEINLQLFQTGFENPVWSGTLKGREGKKGLPRNDYGGRLSAALNMAIKQWHGYPDFQKVLVGLSGNVPSLSSSQPAVPTPSAKQQMVSGGTGFLFNSRDYIITNYHVVKGANSIEVKFPDGEIIKASVQAKDSQNDIAVLKLAKSPSTQIPDLKFGDSSKVRPGDKVFTIGYPASSILGKNQKITDGIISSVTGINDDPTMFQITVPIQPGNSGGPLFNERGEVIGITTASLSLNAIQSLGAVPQNVNYAIKSSLVNNLLTTIPKTLLSNRGIVVVPNKPGNSLSDFFERVSNNVVLIEAK